MAAPREAFSKRSICSIKKPNVIPFIGLTVRHSTFDRFDAPREDTTTTSFEAHVRMRLSRPRLRERRTIAESPRRENQMHGRGAAASQVDQRSSSRPSAPGRTSKSKSACPDCGGFSCDVTGIQTGGVTCGCDHGGCCCATSSEDEVQSAACSSESSGSCSSCSHEDACKADASSTRDQSYSAGSVSSTSACSGCREPEIGTLLRTTASFCETLARALSADFLQQDSELFANPDDDVSQLLMSLLLVLKQVPPDVVGRMAAVVRGGTFSATTVVGICTGSTSKTGR
ncbi:hypothetical protein HPB51_006504 [Rhipicephalus microplus]|uniref:Uncharacterized protein n=1 Tax=Rhipicephalus microplus TaxID=6941 RepID=A0A9J6E7I1_RHIMP|nr:hypothetical protein HPB51_006504 [Rhipicephalus microplus]